MHERIWVMHIHATLKQHSAFLFSVHVPVTQNQTVLKVAARHAPMKEKEKLDPDSQEHVAISWSLVFTSPVHLAACCGNAAGGEGSPRGFTCTQRHLNIRMNGRREAKDVFPDRHKDHRRKTRQWDMSNRPV